ncbi:hypothetical protein [Legionella sp. WA2022007384]
MRRLLQTPVARSGFNQSVLSSLSLRRGGLFTPDKLDPAYPLLTPQEIDEGIAQLHESLPSDKDFLYRGTEGSKEVYEAMSSNYLGMSSMQKRKTPSIDLVRYLIDNDSKFFFSTSPCKYTVQPYAAGISIIPCRGFIWVTGMPKVFTRPQKHLYLNEELFDSYSQKTIEASKSGEKYHSIKNTAAANNEVTVVIGSGKDDNWAFKVSEDVAKIVQVRGPGRFLKNFMPSSEILHVQDWTNPGFKKRVWSLEIVFSNGVTMKDFEKMNEKARELGLIGRDERLLTLFDASSVADSDELEELNSNYRVSETHTVAKVHKSIAIGDKAPLLDCITHEIRSSQTLEEIARTSSSQTL